MRQQLWVGVAVCLLGGAGAVVLGRTGKVSPPPATPPVAAGPQAGAPDAGGPQDAGPAAQTAQPEAPPSSTPQGPWRVSPPVRLSSGETFPTVQEALDAVQPGQRVLLSRGVYPTGLRLSGKKNIQLVAEDGPAYFLPADPAGPILRISDCEDVEIRGLWLEPLSSMDEDTVLVDIEDSSRVRLRQLQLGGGQDGIRVRSVGGLLLEDVLAERQAGADLSIEFPLGPVVIRRSRFSSPARPVAMFAEEVLGWEELATQEAKAAASPAEAPEDDETPDTSLTVEDSVFAGGLRFHVAGRPLTLSRSVIASQDPRVFTALGQRVPAGQWLDSTRQPSAEQLAALVAGPSLFVREPASDSSKEPLPSPAATWDGRFVDSERLDARFALARQERGIAEDAETPIWFFQADQPYPLCAEGEDVSLLDKPGGAPVEPLRKCEMSLGDYHSLPTHTVLSQQGEWLQLDRGWVRQDQAVAANAIAQDGWVIPLPLYGAQLESRVKGELTIKGDSELCVRAHCADAMAEETSSSRDEPEPEPPWDERTIEVPEWLPFKDPDIVTNHSPECCPC